MSNVGGVGGGGEARFSGLIQTGAEAHPTYCTIGTVSLPRSKSGRVFVLNTHTHLAPRVSTGRPISLPPLNADLHARGAALSFTYAIIQIFFKVKTSSIDIK